MLSTVIPACYAISAKFSVSFETEILVLEITPPRKNRYNYDSYQKLRDVLFQVKVYASTTFNKPLDA